jgi:hypothetical protein
VRVVETVYELDRLVKGTPKSEASTRKVTLPELIIPELRRHLEAFTAPRAGGARVCPCQGRFRDRVVFPIIHKVLELTVHLRRCSSISSLYWTLMWSRLRALSLSVCPRRHSEQLQPLFHRAVVPCAAADLTRVRI